MNLFVLAFTFICRDEDFCISPAMFGNRQGWHELDVIPTGHVEVGTYSRIAGYLVYRSSRRYGQTRGFESTQYVTWNEPLIFSVKHSPSF